MEGASESESDSEGVRRRARWAVKRSATVTVAASGTRRRALRDGENGGKRDEKRALRDGENGGERARRGDERGEWWSEGWLGRRGLRREPAVLITCCGVGGKLPSDFIFCL
jgi:hypothetical protein